MKVRNIFTQIAFLFLSINAFAQAPMLILNQNFEDAPPGSQVTLHLINQDFINITTIQFSFVYDPEVLEFVSFGNSALPAMESSVSANNGGTILISWFDPTTNGLSLPDGTEFLEITFNRLSQGLPDFAIGEGPLQVEITNSFGLGTIELGGQVEVKEIAGTVFSDENANCTMQEDENALSGIKVRIENDFFGIETYTNSEGNYNAIVPEGEYTVDAIINDLWTPCPSISVSAADLGEQTTNFGFQASVDCETMKVNISTPFIIRCFDASYYIGYTNVGTLDIENATIEVELDPDLTYASSTIEPIGIDGNLLTFELGALSVWQAGSFIIETSVGCEEVELGQTHCTIARAFPQDDCQEEAPLWDGSSLSVTGECQNDEVLFTVSNTGSDMTSATELIIIENDNIVQQESIQLTANESTSFSFNGNGATYRTSVGQSEGHPGQSRPTIAVEGCGTDIMGEFSTGFVTMFPEDDADDYISISCEENVGSFDPNDKSATIRGALEEHYINQNIELEYLIRFQNTGTFTAFDVVILDELSPYLDPSQIELGASSHEYTLNIREGNILEFNFEDIMLPDSTTDLAGSNGFVQFRIAQQVDVPLESVIENTAHIYFDFNEAVITNTVFHTVGKDFLEVISNVENDISEQIDINIMPNPVAETASFDLYNYEAKKGNFVLVDVEGKLISRQEFVGNNFTFNRNEIPTGVYFFEIRDGNVILKSGKLVVK